MFSFKQLIAGIVLIVLVGVGAFFYRNTMERPLTPGGVACTAEAKLCPDGSAVGREGPNCEFSACPFPNVENEQAGVAFVAPAGYRAQGSVSATDPSFVARFAKPSLSGEPEHTITIRRYSVADGKTAEETILEHTRYQPADMQATDMEKFSTKTISGKTFRSTVTERFEAVVQSIYYLPRTSDVLAFEITEHDVTEWTNSTLVIEELPEHQALLSLLASLELRAE